MGPSATPLVVCLGEALVDRLGPLGGDPAVAWEDHLGGAPANVACALARLGTPSAFIGRLGRDAIGAAFAQLFADRGVDQRALQWDPQRPSRVVLVRRDARGERQFQGFAGGASAGFADQALAAGELSAAHGLLQAPARWLLLGTLALAAPASAQAAQQAVLQAAAAGLAIAVDVNWRPTFWDPAADPAAAPTASQRQRLLPLLQQANVLKCTREEAQWLFGSGDPLVVSAALPRRPLVVVTDAERTLRWGRAPLVGSLQPFAVAAIDSTGAGDAFTAGLLHALCLDPLLLASSDPRRWTEAMRLASACGALVCLGAGAINPQPSFEQVSDFLRQQT